MVRSLDGRSIRFYVQIHYTFSCIECQEVLNRKFVKQVLVESAVEALAKRGTSRLTDSLEQAIRGNLDEGQNLLRANRQKGKYPDA